MSAANLSWILERFVQNTPGVIHTQTVSADGMPLAASSGMDQDQCDQFAAITSGLASLNDTAGEVFGLLPTVRQALEFAGGWILINRISSSANLAVICDSSAELGLVGFEMTTLGEQAGELLSPALIAELKNSLL